MVIGVTFGGITPPSFRQVVQFWDPICSRGQAPGHKEAKKPSGMWVDPSKEPQSAWVSVSEFRTSQLFAEAPEEKIKSTFPRRPLPCFFLFGGGSQNQLPTGRLSSSWPLVWVSTYSQRSLLRMAPDGGDVIPAVVGWN